VYSVGNGTLESLGYTVLATGSPSAAYRIAA
jgi:hypothetical protein